MGQTLSGGCTCGAVRYETEAEPVLMLNCHCRDCQKSSGSAFAAVVVVPKDAVQISGEPRYHRVVGQAGKAVERGFCPTCGSQVTTNFERMPDVIGLKAGTLDDPSLFRPTVEIFTDSAQPWDHMDPETQKVPQGLSD